MKEEELYRKMYYRLFIRTAELLDETDADLIKEKIRQAHLETEEMYMDGGDCAIYDFAAYITPQNH